MAAEAVLRASWPESEAAVFGIDRPARPVAVGGVDGR